ncbi:BQ5605_C018g08650 [Microbotryum silenes-dioicae]|uniref:BQ5605_C018g08650 protein n=1 Tax=Microbotryum silenes-dioicae TaxID=796604 RepID=A0A2X0LWL6_9BASI|nr:BQ5605_C018g08650 [Microbotryum silenes-dioicae]
MVGPSSLLQVLVSLTFLPALLALPSPTAAPKQLVLVPDEARQAPPTMPMPGKNESGHGHFSKWSRKTKKQFLYDLSYAPAKAQDWVIVMGNEAGDLDSMVSALAMSYTMMHLKKPVKAVALLQTEQGTSPINDQRDAVSHVYALYLRPENSLALHKARMASHHRDLLTIDELLIKPQDMWHRIKGIALVDHNVPTSVWGNTTVVSIIDHHTDRGVAPHASPRIVEVTASCTSLVAKWMLDLFDSGKAQAKNDHLPHELIEIMLRTIAIDSSGLKKATPIDEEATLGLWAKSKWSKHHFEPLEPFVRSQAAGDVKEIDEEIKNRMKAIDDELSQAKKNLTGLDVRALLRRDWKGGVLTTKSEKYPHLSLGFASAPVSLAEQIERTPEGFPQEWFAIERAWTAEIGADVSVCLTSFKDEKGKKTRELALVVAHGFGKRLHEHAADSLFQTLKRSIENAGVEDLQVWERPDGKPLLPRRAVYRHHDSTASRKMWRPVIEKAAMEWTGDDVDDDDPYQRRHKHHDLL